MNRNWIFLVFFPVVSILILFGFFPTRTLAVSDPILLWSQTTSLFTIANHSSFSHNNYLYSLGGSTSDDYSIIQRTKIDENGLLNNWDNFANLPMASYYHSSILNGDKIYVLGGTQYPPANSIDNVLLTSIDSNGNFSDWISLTSLPKKLSKGKAVIVNNRIYFVGGATWTNGTGPEISNNVYFANINVDGTISGWITTTSLPTPLSGHGLIETNGKIITLGGSTNSGETPMDKTYSATVFADGTLSSWTEGTNLPTALRDGGAVKIGSYTVYVGGVIVGGQLSDKVYYSPIDANGNLGTWTQSGNDLPITHCCGSLAVWYNRLYLSGGHNGSNYLDSVYTASTTAVAPPTTPTPTPTPSPTPTPTPLPSLIVEDIKQYDPLWKDETYDSINSANPTIQRWGCALTSASMVLKYHGFSDTDPKVLNTWLISQTDGYLGNGLLNWLAVSRYTFLNKSDNSPTLEYRRISPTSLNLINELENDRPAILKVPGHFIVAKSQTSDSFGINDPAYAGKTTLASYGNTFSAINSYRPTSTDLSYLLLTIGGGYTFKIYGPDGTEITGYTFTEEPLIDDVDGSASSGETLTIFQYPTPSQGEYKVEISGSEGSFKLNVYSYDNSGNLDKDLVEGNSPTTLQLNYDTNPPSVPVLSLPVDADYLNTIKPTLTWEPSTDTGSGLSQTDTYHYQIDDEATFTLPLIFNGYTVNTNPSYTPTLFEGKFYWRVAARDVSGNSSDFSQSRYFVLDITAPTTPGIPSTTSPTNSLFQTWSWNEASDTISGVLQYVWNITGSTSGTTTVTNVTTNLNEGNWNFFVKAQDFAGIFSAESSNSVTVDVTPPTGSWTNPAADSTISGVVNLSVSANDAGSGVKDAIVSYKRNNGIDSFHILSESSWDTTTLPLDEYTLRAKIADNAGNSVNIDQNVNIAAVISAQSSTTPTSSSAIVTWSTDRQASSRVVYDTLSHSVSASSANYGYAYSSSTFDTNPKVLSHSVTLTELAGDTTYYYRTVSAGSPVAISEERTFRTLSIAGPPAVSGIFSPAKTIVGTNPVAVVQSLLSEITLTPEQQEQEIQEVPEKEVLGETTQYQKRNFIKDNLGLIIILFSALAGISYLQIARPITGKTSKKLKKA